METALVVPYTETSLRLLKIAALYFDHISLQQQTLLKVEPIQDQSQPDQVSGVIRERIPFIDDAYLKQIEPLRREGIVSIKPESYLSDSNLNFEYSLREIFINNDHLVLNLIKREGRHYQLNVELEANEIFNKLVGPTDIGSMIYLEPIYSYYSGLFSNIMKYSLKGLPVVSSSKALYQMLQAASNQKIFNGLEFDKTLKNYVKNKFAFDVIETLVLNVGDLELEQVLEARHSLNDELMAYRDELSRLQFEFENEFGIEKIINEGRSIANARLLPRINEIDHKIKKGKHSILKKLLTILQKPDPYVPIIGSSFAGLPVELALLISLGLASSEVAIDVMEEKKEIKRDGLFYLMQLRQKAQYNSTKKDEISEVRKGRNKNDTTVYHFVYPWETRDPRQ